MLAQRAARLVTMDWVIGVASYMRHQERLRQELPTRLLRVLPQVPLIRPPHQQRLVVLHLSLVKPPHQQRRVPPMAMKPPPQQ